MQTIVDACGCHVSKQSDSRDRSEAGSERPRLPAKVAALCCRTQAQNGDII